MGNEDRVNFRHYTDYSILSRFVPRYGLFKKMLEDLSPLKLLIIVAVIMLLFGGKKIPELMHGLGRGINEFKRASQAKPDEPQQAPETPKV